MNWEGETSWIECEIIVTEYKIMASSRKSWQGEENHESIATRFKNKGIIRTSWQVGIKS